MVDERIIVVMTTWLSTVMTHRPRIARHLGAGYDADMRRMAAELALMDQGGKRAHVAETARTRSVFGGKEESMRVYPERSTRMADRQHMTLSMR